MKNPLLIAIFGIAVAGITFGLVSPVTVILLETNHTPSWVTGLVTTMLYISIVLFSSLTGKLIEKYNIKKVLSWGLLIVSVCSIGLIFWRNYYILFPARFLQGIGVTFIFVATEVLINTTSDETNRGKNIGLYVMFLSIGIAVGTMLIWTVRIYEWLPFVIGALTILFVYIFEWFLLVELKPVEELEKKEANFPFKMMPVVALFSSAVYGIFESSITIVIPLFGLRSRFSEEEVSLFLGAYVIGGIILLYLIGRASDRISKFKLLLIVSGVLSILFLLPGFFPDRVLLTVIFFIIGGFVPAFYTVGLTYTVERVDKAYVAQANGHFAMSYGIGTLAGPVAGSMLVEFNRQYAFWIASAILCLSFLVYFSFFYGRKNRLRP
ncbi:MAG: MFS transporter [Bacteroidota bacterium]|jgi:MFS family permease|nr:MFS transporter [Ignavibacteria bacterium]MCU7500104.1 MFS transporter [Ignavibacteria bacterium]MCU7513829.1 MFS transporter [Ignavibacteria bacterium]MCU7520830.1 MFS transporter [Ignavibacteria bacterium]MCU7525269.1 MFS transporter [Ignavibacteria bacterium]